MEAAKQELGGHSHSVSSVAWPAAETIVSGSWDNTVCPVSSLTRMSRACDAVHGAHEQPLQAWVTFDLLPGICGSDCESQAADRRAAAQVSLHDGLMAYATCAWV